MKIVMVEHTMPNGDPEYDKYRILHGGFDPSPDLSPSRLYQPAPKGRGLIRAEATLRLLI